MKIIIMAILALPFISFASTVEKKLIKARAAKLQLCPYEMGKPILLGCSDSIQLNKKTKYKFDLDESASTEIADCLNRLVGSYHFHGIRQSPSFDVTGYVTKVKGYYPNPTIEFEVFHIVDSKKLCSIPTPR